jgi:4-amino-4-deoxy-L-arabinose transferase-like glycosyltransferase
VLIPLAVIAGLYLIIAGRSTLWDRDEPRFSRATVEMIESGNYLVPTFNGHLRPDKPILIYWLMSIPVRIFGPTAFACRFVSAIGMALTGLFTFLIGVRLLDGRAALWSVVVLASTVQCVVLGTAATADAVLLPCMTACMAIFVWAWPKGRLGLWDTLGMGLSLGLAQLTKGPVGLLPVLVIATILVILRGQWAGKARRFVVPLITSALIGVGLFLAWGIPANAATGGEFLQMGIGHHVLERSARPLEGHGGGLLLFLPYYPVILMATFFPWTLHLFGGIARTLSGELVDKTGRAILLGWVAAVVILMTLVATKLPHYVLFAWPALSLMVGGTLAASERETLRDPTAKWLRGGVWALAPVALAAAVGIIVGPWALPLPGLRPWGVVCGLLLAATAIMAIRYQLADLPCRSAKVLVAGMVLMLVPLCIGVFPGVERQKVSPRLAKAVVEQTPGQTPVAAFVYAEPSLNFYIGRPIETLKGKEDVIGWLGRDGPGVLIIPRDTFAGLVEEDGPFKTGPVASVKGINYSKGQPIEILAVSRMSHRESPQ